MPAQIFTHVQHLHTVKTGSRGPYSRDKKLLLRIPRRVRKCQYKRESCISHHSISGDKDGAHHRCHSIFIISQSISASVKQQILRETLLPNAREDAQNELTCAFSFNSRGQIQSVKPQTIFNRLLNMDTDNFLYFPLLTIFYTHTCSKFPRLSTHTHVAVSHDHSFEVLCYNCSRDVMHHSLLPQKLGQC